MLGIVTHPLDRWVQAIMVNMMELYQKHIKSHLKLNDIGRSGKTSKVPGNHYRGISGCLRTKGFSDDT
jgi:hypothetical protein